MVELSEGQRRVLTDKLPDVANVAAGAMVFGQFLGDRPFSMPLATAGAVAWLALSIVTLFLARRRES